MKNISEKKRKKVIFIAWNDYHTRNASISTLMGVPSYHFGKRKIGKIRSLLSYLSKTAETVKLLIIARPAVAIVTNTFFLPPLICFAVSIITKTKVVLDTHSSGLNNILIAYPKLLIRCFSKRAALNIVTNNYHKKMIESWGGKVFVLPDPPVELNTPSKQYPVREGQLNICFINTYSEDEPYTDVIKCASELPNVNFYITGNNKGLDLPLLNNVTYTGFIERDLFVSLLNSVDAILVLTTRENTFQCGGNEALSIGRPLIISDTEILRKYFLDSCIYVKPDKDSIKNGILQMSHQLEVYRYRIKNLLHEKKIISRKEIESLEEILCNICK